MTTKLFSELGLSGELLKAIDKLGFEQASPIQAEAIPVLLQGKDVVGQSQTGSGKTLAFAAPTIDKIDVNQRTTQALILCPTRELALQVTEEVHKLAFFKRGLHPLPVYGGQSYDRQLQGLRQGAHIVIGTPGRVMDHMRRGTLRLNSLKVVVLDEVDVMLNMGFREDIDIILQDAPKERQTVFFSATIPRPIQELINKHSREPQHVRIEAKAMTVPTVEQVYYEVDRRFKVDLLTRLIDLHDLKLGIVFCNTRRMVDDLVEHLNGMGYSADRLHGDMSQAMRDRVMNRFRKSGLEFLVATDVAARGIDVENVEVVFNYDLPYDGEDYVHRIGRTGRKGRSGRAISFASGREVFQIRNIERYTNMRIHRAKPPTLNEVEEARANVVLAKIRDTLKSGEYKRQDALVERLLEEGFSSTDIASALLHHLQGGEVAPSAKPQREEPREREEGRGRREDRRERFEPRAPRFREERGERWERPVAPRRSELPRQATARKHAPGEPPRRDVAGETPATKPAQPSREVPAAAELEIPPAASAALAAETTEPAQPKAHDRAQSAPQHSPKASRRTPNEQTRLFMKLGEVDGVSAPDVVSAILGATGLPKEVVGTVDIRERHLFVDVASEHANGIISKLKRAQIKGRNTKVKAA